MMQPWLVVWADFRIDPGAEWGFESADPGCYQSMLELSEASVARYFQEPHERLRIQGRVGRRTDVFREVWQWLGQHRDRTVLFLDSDTLMVAPTRLRHLADRMRLFAETDPPEHPRWPRYMNCGVRLFPQGLDPQVWQVGDTWYRDWDHSVWDHEQHMYNAMFWSQPRELVWRWPGLNFAMPGARPGVRPQSLARERGCAPEEIQIVHYHATRGQQRALAWAQQEWQHHV